MNSFANGCGADFWNSCGKEYICDFVRLEGFAFPWAHSDIVRCLVIQHPWRALPVSLRRTGQTSRMFSSFRLRTFGFLTTLGKKTDEGELRWDMPKDEAPSRLLKGRAGHLSRFQIQRWKSMISLKPSIWISCIAVPSSEFYDKKCEANKYGE